MLKNDTTKKKLQNRNLFFLLALALLIIPLSSAVTYLDSYDVFNTTYSNSSLTFSIPITVDSVNFTTHNITVLGITCLNGTSNISNLFWNTPNANYDSSSYCFIPPYDPIDAICSEAGISFIDAAGLIGLLMTILFIGTVLSFLVLSFKGVIEIGEIAQDMSLEKLVGGIIVIGLTYLILSTMAFVLINGFCGAII